MATIPRKVEDQVSFWSYPIKFCFSMEPRLVSKRNRCPAKDGQGAGLKALDAWIDKQDVSLTRPEAIRTMMETIFHILSKAPGVKPARKAKGK